MTKRATFINIQLTIHTETEQIKERKEKRKQKKNKSQTHPLNDTQYDQHAEQSSYATQYTLMFHN